MDKSFASPHYFSKRHDWLMLVWILSLHAGAAAGFFVYNSEAMTIAFILFWITGGIGICLAYHRLFTHQAFTVSKPMMYLLALAGCLAAQGGPIAWAATHRYHHSHSDKADDCHSPKRGFFWAHMGWLFAREDFLVQYERYKKFAPDLAADPVLVFMDRFHILIVAASGAVLYAFGGWPYVVWGLFVRAVAGFHAAWLVNSAGHIWGYRNFNTPDLSRNNPWVALVSFGEGWHNNHHAFPGSARHGLFWWEPDVTYWTIRFLALLGLAKDVHVPADTRVMGVTKSV